MVAQPYTDLFGGVPVLSRLCPRCKQSKPLSAFYPYHSPCKVCHIAGVRMTQTKNTARNAEGVHLLAAPRRCTMCGIEKPPPQFNKRLHTTDGLDLRCRECVAKVQKAAYAEAPDKALARAAQWAQDNPERFAANQKAWGNANRDKLRAGTARRRAAEMRAEPAWLTPAHHAETQALYLFTAIFSWVEPLAVDHQYPLQGRKVCGLHTPSNLQILTRAANSRKKNKMPDPASVRPYIERPSLVIADDGTASLTWA